MEVPFIYGIIATGKDFCDREKETTYWSSTSHR